MKVLAGTGYTQSRIAGILFESWCEKIGRIPKEGDTLFGHGTITTNSITGEVGLIVDVTDSYYALPEIHANRLVNVVDGDGWINITEQR